MQAPLDEAKSIWRKITILRSEVFAHLSDAYFEAKFAAAKLSPNNIERLIELLRQLVNKLSYQRTTAPSHSTSTPRLTPAICSTASYDLGANKRALATVHAVAVLARVGGALRRARLGLEAF